MVLPDARSVLPETLSQQDVVRDIAIDVSMTTLTVTKDGTGDGTITSSPSGMSCGTNPCVVSFITGNTVTLTATANTYSTFVGWTGACSGTYTCTIRLDEAKTVGATFDQLSLAISVTKTGAGSGIVTSVPAGIDCGSTCSANFPALTNVALTAVADSGSVFTGWSGGCTGSGACSIGTRTNRSVSATFAKATGAACTASIQCQTGLSCLDGVCCTQSTCAACQNCGSDGLCGVGVANAEDPTGTTCTGKSICDGAHACKAKGGEVCVSATDCASGTCTDGHCCTQTCGVCQSCTGAAGICAAITANDDPDSCTGSNTCDMTGACKKRDGQACTAGSECASSGCNAGVCAEPIATGPSCLGLPKTCGPIGNQSCCSTLPVPGGSFYRAYDGVNLTDKTYPASVASFYLDKYPVTVGRFRAFVNAGMGVRATAPVAGAGAHPLIASSGWNSDWTPNLPTSAAALATSINCSLTSPVWTDTAGGNEELPMDCMSWYLAFAFCYWDGGRLPTEAEAMYAAAGGSEQRSYPWGSDAVDVTHASYGCLADGISSCTSDDILAVGSLPKGIGRWKQMDLSGNVWEWVLDWYLGKMLTYVVPCDNCANLTPATYRETHGGSYASGKYEVLAGYGSGNSPGGYFVDIGVRCARDKL